MDAMSNCRTGGKILVDQLVVQGVDHIFCVPGESFLPVLDALYDAPVELTVCRQETGAGIMAEVVGRATGRPGIVFVTRGPGATNAAHAVHIADQASTPLILFIGQVGRGVSGRDAFQEMDYRAFFGSTAKWVTQIDDIRRIPELVSRAFHVALQGRPGPVVIALPEDMLQDSADVADAPCVQPLEIWPGAGQMRALRGLLQEASRPLMIVGGSGWSETGAAAITRFAQCWHLPTAASFRRATLIPNDHPCYAGEVGIGVNPKLRRRIEDADLLLLIGGRMGDIPSQGYQLLDIPAPRQQLVHVHAEPQEIGRLYAPDLAIVATSDAFAASAAQLAPPATIGWLAERDAAHATYLEWTRPPAPSTPSRAISGESVGLNASQLAEVFVWLREKLPADAIVTNGAGNFALWVGRFLRFRRFGGHFGPVSGSMGYGLPAAVGVQRLHPERMVVCFCGDGDFLMNGQEFATAVQYDLPILVVVIDNGMYGTIRMHQERRYPGRVCATSLRNPDFAGLARAFGGHGETVEQMADFAGAFERCREARQPSILHLRVDPDAITPNATLSSLRAAALAR